MKLCVLADNNVYIGPYLRGEPGFSCYIEDGDTRLLLDTGFSPLFLENARALGVDLGRLDAAALSHGHNDHTCGLPALMELPRPREAGPLTLVGHPRLFEPRKIRERDAGCPVTREQAAQTFDLRLSRQPVRLSEHITWLGEIPRVTPFEAREPLGMRLAQGGWEEDFLPDDTGLVYEDDDGLFLIVGCAHCGVCNLAEAARKLCGNKPVKGILGGFHLRRLDERAEQTAEYLEGLGLEMLYPCHCTCFDVKARLARSIPVTEVGVGLTLKR